MPKVTCKYRAFYSNEELIKHLSVALQIILSSITEVSRLYINVGNHRLMHCLLHFYPHIFLVLYVTAIIAASEASGIIFLTALDLKIFIIRDDLLNPQCIGQ